MKMKENCVCACIYQKFVVPLHPQTHAGVSAWMSQGEGADII